MTNAEFFALLKKNPIGVGCAVLSLALAVGIYFRRDEIPAATDELVRKSDEGSRLAANLQNAAQLKEQVDILAACEKEVDARLIHASQSSQTLNSYQYFYKLESETGVKMTGISQLAVAAKSGPKTIYNGVPFTITVQGALPQIMDYLRRLENGLRYCRVMTMTCSVPVADRNSPLTLMLNLELLGQP